MLNHYVRFLGKSTKSTNCFYKAIEKCKKNHCAHPTHLRKVSIKKI